MLASAITFALALGLTAASPTRRQTPVYPPTENSQGFNLIVNVTDSTHPLAAAVNHLAVTSYHTGAGSAFAVAHGDLSTARIFYVNGTAQKYAPTTTLTDGGSPTFPNGIYVQNQTEFSYQFPDQHAVDINVGSGDHVALATFPEPISFLYGPTLGTYAVCDNKLPQYESTPYYSIIYAYTTITTDPFEQHKNIPEGCAEVKLLAQCATLNELPAGSLSSHEYAINSRCYEDVAAIDWTVYSA